MIMETQTLPPVGASASASQRPPLQRVRDAISALGCSRVWARGVGHHVLVGLPGDDPFARLTPLGGSAFGLAFRAVVADGAASHRWEPMFLVDELGELVEHALVAVDALGI
jgi:hypothetical protein